MSGQDVQGQPARRRLSNRGVGLAVAAILIAAAGIGFYLFMERSTDEPPGRTGVAEFSGDSDETTGSFSVQEPWQIHWENEGESFTFAIRGDRDYGTVIEQDGPGSGVSSPVGSGTFHLEVTADGPWRIRILQDE